MRQSMTGFAARTGAGSDLTWQWEIRGVNGKGLDLRLRLPDWIVGLDPLVRKAIAAQVTRGSIQVSLKIADTDANAGARLDDAHLTLVLDALERIEAEAMVRGLALAPSTAADLLAQRGMLTTQAHAPDIDTLRMALMEDLHKTLDAFCVMRRDEGVALALVIERQLSEIAELVAQATQAAEIRAEAQGERLRSQLARVMDNADGVEPGRLAQELALIAVKSDITEELDRLHAHVDAARLLMAEPGSIGRKLDFLCQEFNREANTLCSKSGDGALTQIGLALKTVIDQMREQVQNVE